MYHESSHRLIQVAILGVEKALIDNGMILSIFTRERGKLK
jgi:hypothetical protein